MNKEKTKILKKIKLLLSIGLILPSKIPADQDLNVEIWGNPEYANRTCDMLSTLPEEIKQYLKQIDMKIVILEGEYSAEKLWNQFSSSSPSLIRGFIDTYDHPMTLYVEGSKHTGYYEKYSECSQGLEEDEFYFFLVRDTLLHELGHCIDASENFNISNSSEFKQIYQEEVQNFMLTDEYNIDNLKIFANIGEPVEYFASAFSAYISYPDNLKLYCPKTYNFIQNDIDQKKEVKTFMIK